MKISFFFILNRNPLVIFWARNVTAHQSSVGGKSFHYLLAVTACVWSFQKDPGVWARFPVIPASPHLSPLPIQLGNLSFRSLSLTLCYPLPCRPVLPGHAQLTNMHLHTSTLLQHSPPRPSPPAFYITSGSFSQMSMSMQILTWSPQGAVSGGEISNWKAGMT